MSDTRNDYQEARDIHAGLCEMFRQLPPPGAPDKEGRVSSFEVAIRHVVPPGLYEHFKSMKGDAKFYLVHGATAEVNRHTAVVTYASLYGEKAGLWTHRDLLPAADGFLSPIDREVYTGPRFRLVEKLTLRQMGDILDYIGRLTMMTDPVLIRMFISEVLKKKVPMW